MCPTVSAKTALGQIRTANVSRRSFPGTRQSTATAEPAQLRRGVKGKRTRQPQCRTREREHAAGCVQRAAENHTLLMFLTSGLAKRAALAQFGKLYRYLHMQKRSQALVYGQWRTYLLPTECQARSEHRHEEMASGAHTTTPSVVPPTLPAAVVRCGAG